MDLVLVQPANATFFFDIGLGVLSYQPELLLQLVLPPGHLLGTLLQVRSLGQHHVRGEGRVGAC